MEMGARKQLPENSKSYRLNRLRILYDTLNDGRDHT
jgi:hypothetical protein